MRKRFKTYSKASHDCNSYYLQTKYLFLRKRLKTCCICLKKFAWNAHSVKEMILNSYGYLFVNLKFFKQNVNKFYIFRIEVFNNFNFNSCICIVCMYKEYAQNRLIETHLYLLWMKPFLKINLQLYHIRHYQTNIW